MTSPRGALVIGYGNRLRGDDAVGPLVADAVANWGLAGVEAIAVHQLTPELAARLAEASRVVFVDAAAGGQAVSCRVVRAAPGPAALGHALDPGGLLELATQAFGRAPEAWLLTIPANVFELGTGPSATAQAGFETALRRIRGWLLGTGDPASRSAADRGP